MCCEEEVLFLLVLCEEDEDGEDLLVVLFLLDLLSAYEERLSAEETRLAKPMPKPRYASAVQWKLDLRRVVRLPMACCAVLCLLLSGEL